MRINDLERRTGLDRATIRYYEKEGLITPTRQENGYRDYSDDDREQLLKIKLLRQLGMSLDKIRSLQQGSEDFQSALTEQLRVLTNLRRTVDRSMEVCRMMQSDNVTYGTMNAEHYIQELSRISAQSEKPAVPKITDTFSEQVPRPWHPWRRFIARYLDLVLLSAIITFVQVTLLNKGLQATILNPFSLLMMLMMVPVEAVCCRLFSTTPGKWAMGITVDSSDGCHHSLRSAFTRAWRVYRYGMGFGIPIWILYKHYVAYRDYNNNFETEWDDESELTFKSFDWKRYAAAALIVILPVTLNYASITISKQPLYRNTDVNIEQFSEIYNYYWELNDYEEEWGLDTEGFFMKKEDDPYVFNANGDLCFDDFAYELDGEYITGLSYTEEWNDLFIVDCKPSRGYVAAAALLSTRDETDFSSVLSLYDTLDTLVDEALRNNENNFTYHVSDLVITWKVEYENAVVSSIGLVHSDTDFEDDEPGYAKIEMTVRIESE